MKTSKYYHVMGLLLFIFILICIPGALMAQSGKDSGKNPAAQKNVEKASGKLYDNSAKADETRRKNIETIKKFLELDGSGDTTQLFVDGGSYEQTFPFYGDEPSKQIMKRPQPQASQQSPQQTGDEAPELTIDWKVFNQTIHYTEDPDYIIVENYGSGKQLAQNGEYVPYSNHYFHTFRMQNGLIKEYREITNPLKLYKAFGISVGHMPTPDETMKAATTAKKAKAPAKK